MTIKSIFTVSMFGLLSLSQASWAAPSVSGPVAAQAADDQVILPRSAASKSHFARYYLLATVRTDEDAPFTTSLSFKLNEPRVVWLGVFIRSTHPFPTPTPPSTSDPSGVRVVSDVRNFPNVVHGGCHVVNVVADAHSGRTLASWCNVLPANGRPDRDPVFAAKGSPIH